MNGGEGMNEDRASAPEPRPEIRFRRKVVIYATWQDQLLVFNKPDFPGTGVEVPGGTVEDGEAIEAAARREFSEETGLDAPPTFHRLGEATYRFQSDTFETGARNFEHLRTYFHVFLDRAPSAPWEWVEQTPDGGGLPIRMRFSFVPLQPLPKLFGSLDAFLPEVLARLGLAEMSR
jgi:8-oxo-dGTP diphosphatase